VPAAEPKNVKQISLYTYFEHGEQHCQWAFCRLSSIYIIACKLRMSAW